MEGLESYTLLFLIRAVFFWPRSEYSYFSANLRLKYSLKLSRKVFLFGNLQIDYQIHCLVSRHVGVKFPGVMAVLCVVPPGLVLYNL